MMTFSSHGWVAVDHHDTGHPHTHILIRGRCEDGKTLNIAGDYIAHGVRHRASEIMTRALGPQTEREVTDQLAREVDAERLTRLDRALIARAKDNVVDLRLAPGGDPAFQQLLVARVRKLEAMELASSEGPLTWTLDPHAERVLGDLGRRGDIIRTMHQEMTRAGLGRRPELYVIHDPASDDKPITGRVIRARASDAHHERRYVLIDGHRRAHLLCRHRHGHRQHRAGHGCRADPEARGAAAIRSYDRRGRCRQRRHLYDRRPSRARPPGNPDVRRSTCSQVGSDPPRQRCGRAAPGWLVDHRPRSSRPCGGLGTGQDPKRAASDRDAQCNAYREAHRARWADDTRPRAEHVRANGGFGGELRQALARRQQWLLEEGFAWREGEGIAVPEDLVAKLRARELATAGARLSRELGLDYVETKTGTRISGTLARSVDIGGNRYALIEKSKEFTLVPWRDVLERQVGKSVSGVMRDGGISWTFGRERGGPSIS